MDRRPGLVTTGVGIALLLVGIALVADAVRRGDASFALVLIVPVVYGASAELGGGIALIVVGLFVASLGWALGAMTPVARGTEGPVDDDRSGGVGGVVLIGPVPIFFGSARRAGRRTYLFAVLAGAALFVVAVALVVLGFAGR